jgi:hypothetical protein
MLKTTCFALAAMLAGGVSAQTAARPDPADPKAVVPERPYESAFKGYKPYVDADIARWSDANREVGRLGGHAGHVPRESGASAKPGAKPPAPTGPGADK